MGPLSPEDGNGPTCGTGLFAQWALALLPGSSLFPTQLLYLLLLLMAFGCLLLLSIKFPPQSLLFLKSPFKDWMTAHLPCAWAILWGSHEAATPSCLRFMSVPTLQVLPRCSGCTAGI